MKIEIKISNKRIRELISEAGSAYWATDFRWVAGRRSLAFLLTEYAGKRPEKRGATTTDIMIGLTKMANAPTDKGGHHFDAVRDDLKSDMFTGDAIIQFAIFGKLKYG